MFVKAMAELRGQAVLGRDGPLGVLEDFYFEAQLGQLHYLALAPAGRSGASLLVSAGCLKRSPSPGVLRADLSQAQARSGAGAWPVDRAVHWLERERLCCAGEVIGMPVQAQDGFAGRLADLLVDLDQCSIDYALLAGETGQLLVPFEWLRDLQRRRGISRVQRTRAQLHELQISG